MSSTQRIHAVLTEQCLARKKEFQAKYPAVHDWIASEGILEPYGRSLAQESSQTVQSAISFTLEEYEHIIEKLRDLAVLPPAPLESELGLYLEQQLSDLTGVQCSATLEAHSLPAPMAILQSLPHQKRHPTDHEAAHERVPEAGFSEKRSIFGWDYQNHEEFGISFPLQIFAYESGISEELLEWYKYKKFLLINPFERRAVIASMSGVVIPPAHLYQFGASPELSRALAAWSPKTLGKVLIFYCTDQSVPLGPVAFASPQV